MTGGDIIEITYNHPVLGSGVIFGKSAEDATIDYGGYRSNDDANMIAGNGEMIDQMNLARWKFEVPCAMDMQTDDTLAKVAAMAGHPQPASWTFQHINGVIWGGKGKPVGDVQGNTNQSTFTLTVSGGGPLKKVA